MGLIGMVLFSVFTYYEISNARIFALKSFEQTVLLETNFITHWFEDNINRVRILSQLPAVRRGDMNSFLLRVELFAQHSPHVTGTTFANVQGKTLDGEDVAEREYFQRAKRGEEYIGDVVQGRHSKQWVVVFSAPVFNDKAEFVGVVISAVKVDALVRAIEGFHLGNTGETYLISESGTRIGSSRLGPLSDNNENPWQGPSIESLYGSERGKIISGLFENAQGERVLGAYGRLEKSRWIVAGEINEYEILEPVYNKILLAGLISIALGILVLYCTAFFARRINQPIAILVEQAQKIELGKLQLLPEKEMISEESPQELVRICQAFQTMARKLIEDIQELDWTNAKLMETEERFRVLAENSRVGVYILDEKGKATYVNPRLCEMLGYSAQELAGQACVMDLIHPDDQPEVARCFEGRKNSEIKAIPDVLLRLDAQGKVLEIITQPKNGTRKWVEEWVEAVRPMNCFFVAKLLASGEMQHYEHEIVLQGKKVINEFRMVLYGEQEILLFVRDITERKEMEEQLKHLSYHDGLTGLYNRAYLDEQLTEEKLQNARPVGIIMADVDGLKQVNDNMGHQEGDRLLQRAANVLRVQEGGIVARIGGDEFIIVLTQTSEEEIKKLCQIIEEKIKIANQEDGQVLLHISLGWSIGFEDTPLHEVFRQADDAMYWNKSERKEEVQKTLRKSMGLL